MATTGVNRGCSSELQGIGSILGSDCKRTKLASAASLKRTLSADMSSRKWLSHHGFSYSSLNKTASSEEFQQVVDNIASDAATEQPPSQLDVWNSIQSDKMKKKESEAAEVVASGKKLQAAESWSSILSQKSAPLPAPYVHPLAKTSRSLNQKSLEICTESLGSETGSDGFSSSETSSDAEDEDEHEQEQEEPIVAKQEQVQVHDDIADYRSYFGSKSTSVSCSSSPSSSSSCSRSVRSFPPPLPSLSRPKLHMRPRRVDGRLVLEAIPAPVPPSHNFHAQRQDGRLRLTFINSSSSPNAETIQKQEQNQEQEEEEEKQQNQIEEKEERMTMNKEEKPIVPTGVIDVQLSAMGMKKLMSLTNRNPRNWTSKLNRKLGHEIEEEQDQDDDEEEDEENSAQKTLRVLSLPAVATATRVPRLISTAATTATATATSFINTYEYCWRTKQATISVGINHPVLIQQSSSPLFTKSYTNKSLVSKNLNPSSSKQYYYQNYQQQKQQFVVLSAADYYYMDSPTIRGCKEPKRSLMIREPCCIATS